MIKIYERMMAKSVMIGKDEIFKIIQTKEFVDFIKDLYDDGFEASVDIAIAINSFSFSALANPVVCDVYDNGKKLNSWFIEIDDMIFDILNNKFYNRKLEMRKPLNADPHLSMSDKYVTLRDYLKTEAYFDNINR